MKILDILQIPGQGTTLIVSLRDPDVDSLAVGDTLTQDSHSWQVTSIDKDRPRPTNIGILVAPASPVPHRGDIAVV